MRLKPEKTAKMLRDAIEEVNHGSSGEHRSSLEEEDVMMEAERRYLNVIKGLLIVLVVVGHFGQTIANNLPSNIAFLGQGVVLFIYLFHMPMFLFISGYLSKNEEKRRQRAFGDLFIPYVLFQTFVGLCLLVTANSWGALRNIFIPQMGAWYLLTLFSYRLVLPEVKRIRGILIIGTLISIFACLGSFDGDFAIKKTLGFFVYFMVGYMFGELPRKRIPSWIARVGLAIIVVLLATISYKTNWYADALSVLSRGADIDSFSQWYFAPLYYAGALVGSIVVIFLVLNSVPEKCKWLEKQGTDTMPMYLSHLILFMAIGYLVNKNNWILTVAVSLLGIVVSLAIFSVDWYRKLFNRLMGGVKKVLLRED